MQSCNVFSEYLSLSPSSIFLLELWYDHSWMNQLFVEYIIILTTFTIGICMIISCVISMLSIPTNKQFISDICIG